MTDKQFRTEWLKVANRIDREEYMFLCNAFTCDYDYFDFYNKMKLFRWGRLDHRTVWVPSDEEGKQLRVLIACFFSNLTIKEFNEMCQRETWGMVKHDPAYAGH